MKKLTRPVLEASLSKYSVIQKLNMVIAIFSNIFKGSNPDDLNQIPIFTAQYASFRLSTLIIPNLSTYVAPPSGLPSPSSLLRSSFPALPSPSSGSPSIIQPLFYTIPLLAISAPKITRKMLIESLPSLSILEKLNLVLAIYDNICLDAKDLDQLNKIMSGYVRFALKHRSVQTHVNEPGL